VSERRETGGQGSKDEPSVLGSLPSTRPNRLGRRQEAGTDAVVSRPSGAKPKAPAKVKVKAATAKPKAAAPKPKPARTPPRKPVTDRTAQGGPQPVRAGAPKLDGSATGPDRGESTASTPSGTELVTTVVQAAGELAQIGLTVGGQILRRAAERLPKP